MVILENVSIKQDCSSKKVLESKEYQTRQIEWDACFNWYAEAYKSLHISKMASLKDSLQKANEKWKMQEVAHTKDNRTDATVMAPSPSFSSENAHCTNSLDSLPTSKRLLDGWHLKQKTTWGYRQTSSCIFHTLVKDWTKSTIKEFPRTSLVAQ